VGKEWVPDRGTYECRFYPYDSKEFRCLDPTIVACKYFDQQFDDFSHLERWQDIPTPNFDRILKYQNFQEEVCNWAYVMGGRLCYDIGELDSWQVIPFFKGIARSGKSTLIDKVFQKFYEKEDVGTLSNNIEKKFGLSSLMDKFMFVSGEGVSIAVKNKPAVSLEWKTPGILGGNEVPNWKDNSGSVLRRILPWNFTKQVREADPLLDKKLEKELPIILLKCIRAYLEYSNLYRDKDIWNVVPPYFKQIQKQVAMVANTLHHFLDSTNIILGKEQFVPQKMFVQAFNTHCNANNLGKPRFNPDFYVGPFSAHDIEVRNEIVTYKGRTYPLQPVVFGVDIVEDEMGISDNH
jgi:adenosyl cobinamide kinase/adenosyl cobinamide phosphate guanylyltransferase